MPEPSSRICRNYRNRNRMNRNLKTKGEYIVWIEPEDDGSLSVYSTDSVFWRDFFK